MNIIETFDKSHLIYLFPQRARLKTEYSLSEDSDKDFMLTQINKMVNNDFDIFKEYLPKDAKFALDVGCGVGLIDVALYKHYGSIDLSLLDKTETLSEDANIRGFNQKYTFYNSLSVTEEVLITNGLNRNDLTFREVDDCEDLYHKKYDIIMSLLSCGWHYPIHQYIDLFYGTLSENGVIVVDIRHNTGQLDLMLRYFNILAHIVNTITTSEFVYNAYVDNGSFKGSTFNEFKDQWMVHASKHFDNEHVLFEPLISDDEIVNFFKKLI